MEGRGRGSGREMKREITGGERGKWGRGCEMVGEEDREGERGIDIWKGTE